MSDWSHQIEANLKAGPKLGFLYLMEMGTGKTKTVIDKIREHMNRERRLMRIVFVTPPLVVPQVREEWLKFSKLDPKNITMLRGSGEKRLKTFYTKAYTNGSPAPHLFITNYESLTMGGKRDKKTRSYTPGPLFSAFQAWAPEVLVFDEAHRIKSPQADRSKQSDILANPWDNARACWAKKPFTYGLTGTPVLNNLLDIFQPFKVALGGFPTPAYLESMGNPKFLITNFFHFRDRYFRDRNASMPQDRHYPNWEVMTREKDGIDAEAEISAMIEQFSYRITKAECMDLPPEISVPFKVGMSEKQARAYKEMKELLITYVNDQACVAKLAITKALRLMQITAGFATVKGQGDEMDPADVRFEDTPKLEALRELLEELTPHHKVLVWAVWKDNYETIRKLCAELKIEIVEAHGGVSEAKKRVAVERFQKDPAVRVFLGHPGSGGIGLNLVQAPYSIFYSRTFSLEHYLQARSRNHRGGSEVHEKITHYDLVCGGTIDELALEALANKREIGAKILGDVANILAKQVPQE